MIDIDQKQFDAARKKGIWIALFSIILIICAIIAIQQLSSISFEEIWKKSSPYPLLLSLFPMSMAFGFMALRWRSLMSIKPPSIELSALICAGLLLNYAAPGPIGEFGAAWFAHKRYPISFSESLASGVIARLIGLLVAAFVGILIWLLADLPIAEEHISFVYGTILLVTLLFFALIFLILKPTLFLTLIPQFSQSGWLGNKLKKIEAGITSLGNAIALVATRGAKAHSMAICWSLCSHGSVIIGIFLIAYSLQVDFDLWGILFTYAITTAGAALLFALPGSYLGWDVLFVGLMVSTANIPIASSVMIAAILRSQQLGYMLLGGLSLGWLLRSSKKDL